MKSLFNRILGKPGEEPAAPEASTQSAASVIDENKLRQALGEAAGDEARLTAEQELGRGLAAIRHPPPKE